MNREPVHRPGDEEEEETPPRSIFSERWFRALLALVLLAVGGVFALPYFLDWLTPPPPTPLVKADIPPPPPPQPTVPAQKAEAPKAPAAPSPAKPEPAPQQIPSPLPQTEAKALAKPEPKAPEPAPERPKAVAPTRGEYWIQVGAFTDSANAARLAARLTAENYPVQRFSFDRPIVGTHEVFVVGASQSEVSEKIPVKDYRAEEVGGEVVIRPALPLKDAVGLSKELARQGFTVKIRRSKSTANFHVVRVGGYPDRQRAQAAQKDLAGKGFSGFIVKGEGR